MDELTNHILEMITYCKDDEMWAFNFHGDQYVEMLKRMPNLDDGIYIERLKMSITFIIGDEVEIWWSDSLEIDGKKLMIKRLNKRLK